MAVPHQMKLTIDPDALVDHQLGLTVAECHRLEMVRPMVHALIPVHVDYVYWLWWMLMYICSIYLLAVHVVVAIDRLEYYVDRSHSDHVANILFRLAVHTPYSLCLMFLFCIDRFVWCRVDVAVNLHCLDKLGCRPVDDTHCVYC